ncbi:hypothetical protein SCHPADRAFT_1001276 [Schizopora paradoxa]|uniref:DUF2415 domain-containing protein n=1 Tax=Schizopora paradoxa TaxID=27342 RepID=A0A0H2RT16_9AGAM|nr:hypothetical protein SCHPADRAFT_1001276 [Schizopora paradoxa]
MALTTSLQRSEPALLSSKPTSAAPSTLKIAHVQLRNLVVCPKDQGVVWYVSETNIVEQDVRAVDSVPHVLAHTMFTPVCLDAICLDDGNVLLVAGGQEAELFLGLYSFMSKTCTIPNSSEGSTSNSHKTFQMSEEIWRHLSVLAGSINNSVMLYVPPIPPCTSREYFEQNEVPFTKPNPRFVVSNNDCSIKIFEVNTSKDGFGRRVSPHARRQLRREEHVDRYQRIGALKLTVPINHTSISPDGSTLLSCGDSSTVHLHRISPWAPGMPLKFEHIASYTLPQPSIDNSSLMTTPPISPYLPYAFVDGQWTVGGGPLCSCFSTAWNSDGSKFAVASQEGMVVVWDVRSGEPLPKARWETSRRDLKPPEAARTPATTNSRSHPSVAMGTAEEELIPSAEEHLQTLYTSDPWVFVDSNVHAPAWGVRCVKFSKNISGQEVLVFTEHASFVHVIDADTFEKHDVIRIPHIRPSASTSLASMSAQHVAAMDSDYAFHAALAVERRRISGSPFDVTSLVALRRQTIQNLYSANEVSSSSAAVPYAYLDVPRVLSSTVPLSRSPEPMISEIGQDGFHNMGLASGQNFHDRAADEVPTFMRRDTTQHRPFVPRVRRSRLSSTRSGGLATRSAVRGPQPYSSSGSALSDDDAHVVVMPSFENEEIEQGIRESLSAHGINVLPPRRRRHTEESSVAQSSNESSSSVPERQESRPSQQAASGSTEATQTSTDDAIEIDDPMSDNECTPPPIIPPPPLPSTSVTTTTTTQTPTAVQSLPPCHELIENTSRLDIGGVAFDPSGTCMYIATVDGISEWTIKGSTTRWWSKGGWL